MTTIKLGTQDYEISAALRSIGALAGFVTPAGDEGPGPGRVTGK